MTVKCSMTFYLQFNNYTMNMFYKKNINLFTQNNTYLLEVKTLCFTSIDVNKEM